MKLPEHYVSPACQPCQPRMLTDIELQSSMSGMELDVSGAHLLQDRVR